MASQPVMNGMLYRRLVRRFGTVKVSRAGEARIATARRNPVTGQPRDDLQQHGEQYYVRCPFCRDSSLSLSINHMYGQLGRNGYQMLHLGYCHRSACLTKSQNRDRLAEMLSAEDGILSKTRIGSGVGKSVAVQPPELPQGMRAINQLPDAHPARQFLDGQGLNPDRLTKFYELGYCGNAASSVARNRIIIPIRQKGELCGWQSLSIAEERRHRYLSAPGVATSKLVYNLDRAREYPTAVIVPETLDVWRFGAMAVSLMGTCSERQVRLISSAFRGRSVVLVTLASEVTSPMARQIAKRFLEQPSVEFASVRISKSQQWRRATRAELRAIVAEEAAKLSIDVGYGKVADAHCR
jgi:hypothetical protein